MVHATIEVLSDKAQAAALALAETELFVPEDAKAVTEVLTEDPAEEFRGFLESAAARLDKVLTHYGHPCPTDIDSLHVVTCEQMQAWNEWLGEIWSGCSGDQERLRELIEEEHRLESLQVTLENFKILNVDLAALQGETHFLDLHLGTVPPANITRLQEALQLAGYVLQVFLQQGHLAHAVVAGPKGGGEAIENTLRAAGWRALQVPPEFREHPQNVAADLASRRERVVAERLALERKIADEAKRLSPKLTAAAQTVLLGAPFARIGAGMHSRGELTAFTGWVPRDAVAHLHYRLRRRLSSPVVLLTREPARHETVPTLMRHPAWLRPFATLVRSFGTPRYGEFDPTWLFAISYIAMFGMMFGDIGHGAVIAALGFGFRRRLLGFAPFIIGAGLSSMFFGLLYGSIFGFEHLFHAVWIAPLTDPVRMLLAALYWGIGFILLVTLLNVYNLWVVRRRQEALLSGRGVAGIVLYLALVAVADRWMRVGEAPTLGLLIASGALTTILGFYWRHSDRPFGERAITVAIEGFETIMGFLSGTLSFLRVAAFSLNHVALATAVFALAAMMDSFGHWTTIVLGNVFIIVLEGAIVAIQTMRLEYYEGFSRFFGGDGYTFKPLSLRLHARISR
jgi:V/A-type H+-transporting ATPase subunit I